jgi:hypothetical protein
MKIQNLILLGLGAFFLLRKTGGINGTNQKNDLGFGYLRAMA